MLTIEQRNVWSYVKEPNKNLWRRIKELEIPLAGGKGLRNAADNGFFSGLLPLVQEVEPATVIDKRVCPIKSPRKIPHFVNRGYQIEAVQSALDSIRGIVTVPTGGGKTRIAAGIMFTLPCSWLYIVHRASLAISAAVEFEKLLGEHVDIIAGDVIDLAGSRIVCATFDSLNSLKEGSFKYNLVTHVQGLIVDECHKIPAKTALGITTLTEDAYYRFGLSATPFMREDHRDIHTVALLGPEIYNIKSKVLIEEGNIVPPEVDWLLVEQSERRGVDRNDYHEVYEDLVVSSDIRNNELAKAIIDCEKPAIVFVKEKKHGRSLISKIISLATNLKRGELEYADSGTSVEQRLAIKQQLLVGKTDVLVCTNIFSDGFDVPNLRTVVNATGEASWKEAIQRMGRGTRPAEDKEKFKIIDVNDIGNRWLVEHTVQRYLAYRAAGYTVEPPNSMAVWREASSEARKQPTMQKPWATEEQKGGLWLIGILGPVIAVLFGFLWRLGRK